MDAEPSFFGVSPGMRFHTAVNKFIWQACVGQPLTVWKTAMNQVRPYLAVSDATRALMFVIQKDIFDRRIYNVLTANATVGEIVEIIRRDIPNAAVTLVESRIMNQLSYHVENKRISSHGFEVKSNLYADIAESISLLKNTRAKVTTS
jgi:nucleoside-diphosphate-sugar epimerase